MGKDPKQHYHDKGQRDAADRDYEPPHGVVDDLTTWSESGMRRNSEENRAYDQGYFNSRGQSDGAKNSYNPPSDSEAKEAYDDAWRASYDETHKSACFLTEACCAHAGLPDDCRPLTVLRGFRDEYLLKTDRGRELVANYYGLAPELVVRVRAAPDPGAHWSFVLERVNAIVQRIEEGRRDEAVSDYEALVRELEKRVL